MNAKRQTTRGGGSRPPPGRRSFLWETPFFRGFLPLPAPVWRADPGGWLFTDDSPPFTFFAGVSPPIALFAHFDRSRPWLRFGLVAFLLVGVLLSHAFLETPGDQYGVWATNASSEPFALGRPNLLNVESPVLGVLAVVEANVLNLSLLAAVVSLFADARRAGTGV